MDTSRPIAVGDDPQEWLHHLTQHNPDPYTAVPLGQLQGWGQAPEGLFSRNELKGKGTNGVGGADRIPVAPGHHDGSASASNGFGPHAQSSLDLGPTGSGPSIPLEESYHPATKPGAGGTTGSWPGANPSLPRGAACMFCRRRKLRCSGGRPSCTSCIKYKKHCEYEATPSKQQARPKPEPEVGRVDSDPTSSSSSSQSITTPSTQRPPPQPLAVHPPPANGAGYAEPAFDPSQYTFDSASFDTSMWQQGAGDHHGLVQQPTHTQPLNGLAAGSWATQFGRLTNDTMTSQYVSPAVYFSGNEVDPTAPIAYDPTTGLAINVSPYPPSSATFSYHPTPTIQQGPTFEGAYPPSAGAADSTFSPYSVGHATPQVPSQGLVSHQHQQSPSRFAAPRSAQSSFKSQPMPPLPGPSAYTQLNLPTQAHAHSQPATPTFGNPPSLPQPPIPGRVTLPNPPSAAAHFQVDPVPAFAKDLHHHESSSFMPDNADQIFAYSHHAPAAPAVNTANPNPRNSHDLSSVTQTSDPTPLTTATPTPAESSPENRPSTSTWGIPNPHDSPMGPGELPGIPNTVDTAVEGLTERLGELLFNPNQGEKSKDKKRFRRRATESAGVGGAVVGGVAGGSAKGMNGEVMAPRAESDGLTDGARSVLLDTFLAHSKLFFELSIPRFRYRMTFSDKRRPNLALLNAMYLWATRFSHRPHMSSMENNFFQASKLHLAKSCANGDRLLDCVRAAMLLTAHAYLSGRFHEGWLYSGISVNLALSTGLHQIPSCTFTPPPPTPDKSSLFLRHKVFLLPPPEDALDLAERIHAFWAVFAVDRCGAMATGFPSGFQDADITTPFPPTLADIAARNVSKRDDLTVRDLYRRPGCGRPVGEGGGDGRVETPHCKWIKAMTVLQRACKLAHLEPEPDEVEVAVGEYAKSQRRESWKDCPRYRRPGDFAEVQGALEGLKREMGERGRDLVEIVRERERQAARKGGDDERESPRQMPSYLIILNHLWAVTEMILHDVNNVESANDQALNAARKSVAIFREVNPLPPQDTDSFCIMAWCMVAKVLIKEVCRLQQLGDAQGVAVVVGEVDRVIDQMRRVGEIMGLARSQAASMEELKRAALGDESV